MTPLNLPDPIEYRTYPNDAVTCVQLKVWLKAGWKVLGMTGRSFGKTTVWYHNVVANAQPPAGAV